MVPAGGRASSRRTSPAARSPWSAPGAPGSRPALPHAAAVARGAADGGRRIKHEPLARAMEPFFTTKAPGSRTGLGLAVCRAIARQHGGKITIDSEEGKGTRVVLRLPFQEGVRV